MNIENIKVGDILWDEGFRRVKILEFDAPTATIGPTGGRMVLRYSRAIKVIDVDEKGQPRKFEVRGVEYTSKPRYLNTVRNLRKKPRKY